ncbi:hypothetical protein MCOR27_011271 [Pyricularia oryzae]|nr:hypothetical protein MCOR01_000939 [Pyricularia oryzae]KAI6290759.1 hypothetical protein MCOR33_011080 [Pyricularia grisea]KAH9427252.1 hypothetical protein MCOR02_012374 [Pyricularia oryzae]KAI6252086.1 hypothetical protein MCOR19_011293 [Pyricularia oryzae]KAI6265802.1 hypothetical protein MCOR27_011271 [Pyricularia oryzae]
MPGGAPPKPPPSGAMSLYANLLDPKAAAGDSTAPNARAQAKTGDEAGGDKKPLDPAMLRFQPMRRPQPGQKPKPKGAFLKIGAITAPATTTPAAATATPTVASSTSADPSAASAPVQQPPRSKLADWAATEDDEYAYGLGKRHRGGRKAKKKNNRDDTDRETDWDELYDPARPTNVEEYLRSDERIAEIREWKGVLYAHRRRREQNRIRSRSRGSRGSSSGSEARAPHTNQFAPPPQYSFVPPQPSPPRVQKQSAMTVVADDATGDDAYARRLALSKVKEVETPPPQPDAVPAATISRAPVRYEPTPLPNEDGEDMDIDEDEGERPGLGSAKPKDSDDVRSNRPGQAGFAARMMEKMGWEKGKGLGAEETGITSGLSVKVEKRRKRPDAEGGGFASPGNMARVVGGNRGVQDVGKFGSMSEVVALGGMLEGMEDVAGEVAEGLAQEIGEECGEKYGRVERLYVDVNTRQVFIKFTDQVSALRAVNALDGRIFNGNEVRPRFYDLERFEQGVYH